MMRLLFQLPFGLRSYDSFENALYKVSSPLKVAYLEFGNFENGGKTYVGEPPWLP